MSKMFFAVFSVATLTLTSLAQTKAPQPSRHYNTIPGPRAQAEPDGHLAPRLCNPCLFYGGNLDVPNIDSAGLSDENTLNVSDSHTYGAVTFPAAVSVTGLLFQVQMSAHMNPKEATWEIRSGVSSGNGGTVVASGTAAATMKPTGRVFLGLGEYSVGVKFPAVSLAAGTYWFNVTPQCTDSSDVQCSSFAARYFVSNTVRQQQNLHGSWQPIGDMFLNSSFFDLNFINWCDASLGLDANQCSALSFGVIGTRD